MVFTLYRNVRRHQIEPQPLQASGDTLNFFLIITIGRSLVECTLHALKIAKATQHTVHTAVHEKAALKNG